MLGAHDNAEHNDTGDSSAGSWRSTQERRLRLLLVVTASLASLPAPAAPDPGSIQ